MIEMDHNCNGINNNNPKEINHNYLNGLNGYNGYKGYNGLNGLNHKYNSMNGTVIIV